MWFSLAALGYIIACSEHLMCCLQEALYSLKPSHPALFDWFNVVVLG